MITSPRSSVSYPAAVEICRFLPYGQRMHISTTISAIRQIHNRLDFSIKSIKLVQKSGDLDAETGELIDNPNGWLRICTDEKSIDYIFIWDELLQKMEILCSLTPGKSIFVDDKSAFQTFLVFFMEKSKNPVEHVDLEECDRPFRNFQNLRIASLNWIVNKGNEETRFANFSVDHRFEKLELQNMRFYLLAEQQVQNAKHLIIRNPEIYEEFQDGQETFIMSHFFGRLKNQMITAEFRLAHFATFAVGCKVLLHNNMHSGSKFTGHFQRENVVENPLEELRKVLRVTVEDGKVDDKECILLKSGEELVVAVYTDAKSFEAVKI